MCGCDCLACVLLAQVVAGLRDFLSKAAAAGKAGAQPDASQPAAAPGAHDSGVLHWRRTQWPGQATAADYQAAMAAAARGAPSGWPGVSPDAAADGVLLCWLQHSCG